MSEHRYQGHPGIGPKVTGTALVAADDFSARYDLDRVNGVFSRPAHKLCGQSYVGRILVLNTGKGGVATSWMLHEMKSRHMAPLALLLNAANPIMAQGAAFAGLGGGSGLHGDQLACAGVSEPASATLLVHEGGVRAGVTPGDGGGGGAGGCIFGSTRFQMGSLAGRRVDDRSGGDGVLALRVSGIFCADVR